MVLNVLWIQHYWQRLKDLKSSKMRQLRLQLRIMLKDSYKEARL